MAINSNKAIKISQKHLLGIQDLSISDVNLILSEAKKFISLNKSKNKKIDIIMHIQHDAKLSLANNM